MNDDLFCFGLCCSCTSITECLYDEYFVDVFVVLIVIVIVVDVVVFACDCLKHEFGVLSRMIGVRSSV